MMNMQALFKKIGLSYSPENADTVLKKVGAPPWLMKSLNKVYETKLPDFFDHACHSAKKSDCLPSDYTLILNTI